MSPGDLLCPECGAEVRLRDGASRKAGKLVYSCRGCGKSFSFFTEEEELVEEPGLDDSGSRTVPVQRPDALRDPSRARLHEMTDPSTSEELPLGLAINLEFIDGPQRGAVLQVTRSRSVLGRDRGDLHVADPLVSRRHAVLDVYDPETVILKDLASTNGTYHNGRLIDHCKLADGDEVRLGSSIINVLIDQRV